MFHIQVPATSANLGSGFDCIGMAFQLYNHLWVEESHQELEIIVKHNPGMVPTNKSNLIYRTICRFYEELLPDTPVPGIKMIQEDYIPPARGLGSSAACVVGGLLAANRLSGLRLPLDKLVNLAAKIEGHPDNSTPALVGGVVVGAMKEEAEQADNLEYIKLKVSKLSDLHFAVMIPEFSLCTEKARSALPTSFSRKDAVFNASRTALLTAALIQGEFDKLSCAVDDRLHQPYRSALIPNMEEIFLQAKRFEARAAFLSGAGPTLIAVVTGDTDGFKKLMCEFLNQLPQKWEFKYLAPDLEGAIIQE